MTRPRTTYALDLEALRRTLLEKLFAVSVESS